jgi:hypothetical protein
MVFGDGGTALRVVEPRSQRSCGPESARCHDRPSDGDGLPIAAALGALRSAVAAMKALSGEVPDELQASGVPFGICDDCGGFGLDVDEDGSLTGVVGRLMVCGCVEMGADELERAARTAHQRSAVCCPPVVRRHLGSFEVSGPWGDER